jgi:heterodisulfide reductase subunit A-like polyferredoxin
MSSPDVNPDGFEVVETDVLVVGSGPIGMITAYQLAHCGQSCILVEQNYETTEYPKMELTQARTMELFRRFGLADELRALGVPPEHNLNEIITTGYGEKGSVITLWVSLKLKERYNFLE